MPHGSAPLDRAPRDLALRALALTQKSAQKGAWLCLALPTLYLVTEKLTLIKTGTIYADFPENWALSFQDPASPWMYAIIDLHDRILFYLIILLIVVVWFLVSATLNSNPMSFHHGNLIELIWTLTPAGILWAIGLPSLKLLYMIDEILDAEITIKAIGSQWLGQNTNAKNLSKWMEP
uniref:Cytochrome c oxidase subunit 2 n=1 Tax=Synchytrium taraxaci TaxID=1383262 RepID=A0A4P8NWG3_9FUNG|nr:cytochrome c oxidase subunit 2 [Synchytrium taraxaci]